jgi:hypothetical protein
MATQAQDEGWGLTHKYLIGAAIGVAVFVICPEAVRLMRGGAFAQNQPSTPSQPWIMPLSTPTAGTEKCVVKGGSNFGEIKQTCD